MSKLWRATRQRASTTIGINDAQPSQGEPRLAVPAQGDQI